MVDPNRQAIPAGTGAHLILYDGECGLCNGLVRFVLKHDHKTLFAFAPLQGDTAASTLRSHGVEQGPLTTFYVIPNYRSASALLAKADRPVRRQAPRMALAGGRARPNRAAAFRGPAVHDVIARHRYRLFGREQLCQLPSPDERTRFVEWQPHTDRG